MYCQSKAWEVQHRTTESCGVSGMKVIDTALKRANLPLGQGGEPTPVTGRIHLGTWTFRIIACGYWNENSHHRLICLTIWYPVGRIVWKWLGGVSLLENMCHGVGIWGSKRLVHFTLCIPASYLWIKLWVLSCSCYWAIGESPLNLTIEANCMSN